MQPFFLEYGGGIPHVRSLSRDVPSALCRALLARPPLPCSWQLMSHCRFAAVVIALKTAAQLTSRKARRSLRAL